MILRPGRADEASYLSDLALRSKGYWGYDHELLDAFRRELTLAPEDVVTLRVVVAEEQGLAVGFSSLDGQPPRGELGHLFVEPNHIGQGVGRLLWDDVCRRAKDLGFERFMIESDPDARPFYLRMGAQEVGRTPSRSIPGRQLPLLEYVLPPD